MSWNYRVVQKRFSQGHYFSIHEVHYDTDGVIMCIDEESSTPFGETFGELSEDCTKMTWAFTKPIVDFDTMKEIK